MARIITAVYDSLEKLTNAVDDLVATGIPRDNIRVDDAAAKVQVAIPNTTEPEIEEILRRHDPADVAL